MTTPLPTFLRQFLFWSAVATGVCGGIEVFSYLVLHLHFPFNFPIFNPGAFAYDLLAYTGRFQYFHKLSFFEYAGQVPFMYPAPIALLYWFFYLFGRLTTLAFLVFSLLLVAISGGMLGRRWIEFGVSRRTALLYLTACFFLSYPFWFELKDGNMEIVLLGLTIGAVWAFLDGRTWLAAACIGFAMALKIYPFVFLGLLVAKKQYRQCVFAVILAAAVNLFSLWAVCPSIAYSAHQIAAGIEHFREYAFLHRLFPEIGYDHSLFALLKTLLPHLPSAEVLSKWLNVYLGIVAVAGCALYFLRIRKLPVVNQVICLTVACIVLPPVSLDYTLMHLYVPWAMVSLVVLRAGERRIRGLQLILVCFVLLCAPLSEFIFRGRTIEGQIKAIVLLVLFYAATRYPLPEEMPAVERGTGFPDEALGGEAEAGSMGPIRLRDGFAR